MLLEPLRITCTLAFQIRVRDRDYSYRYPPPPIKRPEPNIYTVDPGSINGYGRTPEWVKHF